MIILVFANDIERDKFEILFIKYKKLLMHKAYSILGDYMLAEDAVNEAYLRIFKNIHKIDDPYSKMTVAFIVTIAKNCALTLLNKAGSDIEELDDNIDSGTEMESDVLSAISAQRIYELVEMLDEELKNIFILRFAYDMSQKEISETIGISPGNVAVKLHRARKKLSSLLKEEGHTL